MHFLLCQWDVSDVVDQGTGAPDNGAQAAHSQPGEWWQGSTRKCLEQQLQLRSHDDLPLFATTIAEPARA